MAEESKELTEAIEKNLIGDDKEMQKMDDNIIQVKKDELYELEVKLSSLQEYLEKKRDELQKREYELQQKAVEISKKEKDQELEFKQKHLEEQRKFEEKLATEKADSLAEISIMLSEKRKEFEKKLTLEENDRRSKFENELSARKKQVEDDLRVRKKEVEDYLSKLKSEATSEIADKKRNCEKELDERKKQVEDDIRYNIDRRTKEVIEREKNVNEDKASNDEREKKLDEREDNLQEREKEIEIATRKNERERRRLENKQDELDSISGDLDEELNQRMGEKIARYKSELDTKNVELEKLRSDLARHIAEQESIESFKKIYGDEPKLLENEIKQLKSDKNELIERLRKSPSLELEKEYNRIKMECEEIKAERDELRKKNDVLSKDQEKVEILKIEKERTISENNELMTSVNELTQRCARYEEKISRLSSSETRLADREQRIKEITSDYRIDMCGAGLPNEFSEINWLNNILESCKKYGIPFSRRILYSFHTALKIADWSSIVVLAGVSGTGKSELPKLYSKFGGLNFISVPVQPSWDSQESMLGFFNSIDNRFEPEELLKFLVECTEKDEYNKYMNIVLLDEMNLAHVEHYFADFLSKLETRRGTSKNKVPTINVKLGANVSPYKLKLERSILWIGTMNQDETTKSLSDKVLDRGLVINFPRPKKLSSRTTMGILDTIVEESGRPMLERKTWGKWIVRKIDLIGDQEKEMEKYKGIVEEINGALEKVGRALGHRVWQSIEYYILNYPTVVEEREKSTTEVVDPLTNKVQKVSTGELSSALADAMKTAFEDQIVQKIMPKLRGIETRGKGRENLQKIEDLLEVKGFERLKDDFETACEMGYGQFIWSSAKYIEAEEEEKKEDVVIEDVQISEN